MVGKPLKNFGNKDELDDSEEQKKNKFMDKKDFEEKIKALGLGSKESSYLYERIHGDRKTEDTLEGSGSSNTAQVATPHHPTSFPPVDDAVGPSDAPKGSLYHQPKLESPGLYGPGHDMDNSEKQNHKSYIHEQIHGPTEHPTTQPAVPPHLSADQLKGIFGVSPSPLTNQAFHGGSSMEKSKILLPQGITDNNPLGVNTYYGTDFLSSLAAQQLHYPPNPSLAPQGEGGFLGPNPSVASPGVPIQQTHPNFGAIPNYGDPKLMWNAYLQQYGLAVNGQQGQPSPLPASTNIAPVTVGQPLLNRYLQSQQDKKNEQENKKVLDEKTQQQQNTHIGSHSIPHPNVLPGHRKIFFK